MLQKNPSDVDSDVDQRLDFQKNTYRSRRSRLNFFFLDRLILLDVHTSGSHPTELKKSEFLVVNAKSASLRELLMRCSRRTPVMSTSVSS